MDKWQKYIDEVRKRHPSARNNRQVSNEPYQQAVKKGYVGDRNEYLKGGPISTSAGGSGYTQKPPNSRSLSGVSIGEDVDPDSFEKQDTLEPRLWDNQKLGTTPRIKMEQIARDFISSLGIPVEIEDITLTGSLANYNWSKYSDVDLHIIVDFSSLDKDPVLVKAYFDEARMRWNERHNIRIKGYEVEIYVEDASEQHQSSGIYSIMKDDWVIRPDSSKTSIDIHTARKKSNSIQTQINLLDHILNNKNYEAVLRSVESIKRAIRRLRKAGLSSPAKEFSSENIAFKILRRENALEKLNDIKNKAYDRSLSMGTEESEL